MDVCLGCVLGIELRKRCKIGYEYGKVDYPTHILALPKSQRIHKHILYLTLLINFLAATHFLSMHLYRILQVGVRDD